MSAVVPFPLFLSVITTSACSVSVSTDSANTVAGGSFFSRGATTVACCCSSSITCASLFSSCCTTCCFKYLNNISCFLMIYLL
ncbi:hypothetical protein AAHE18_08G243400 [Arachis hypogaea]